MATVLIILFGIEFILLLSVVFLLIYTRPKDDRLDQIYNCGICKTCGGHQCISIDDIGEYFVMCDNCGRKYRR